MSSSGSNSAQLVLAVSSSTAVTSVAVGKVRRGSSQAEVLACKSVTAGRRHAEEISPMIMESLEIAGTELAGLDALSVDIGPGRFTGLRVGLATVKAIGFALDLDVYCATSTHIVAIRAAQLEAENESSDPASHITSVVDARRGEVFQQTFKSETLESGGQRLTEVGAIEVGLPEQLASKTSKGKVAGDGADLHADLYSAANLQVAPGVMATADNLLHAAGGLAPIAGKQVQPMYLRAPDAVANIKAPRS